MEPREKLAELNKAKLEKVEEYLQSKVNLREDHQQKIDNAKMNGRLRGINSWKYYWFWKSLEI